MDPYQVYLPEQDDVNSSQRNLPKQYSGPSISECLANDPGKQMIQCSSKPQITLTSQLDISQKPGAEDPSCQSNDHSPGWSNYQDLCSDMNSSGNQNVVSVNKSDREGLLTSFDRDELYQIRSSDQEKGHLLGDCHGPGTSMSTRSELRDKSLCAGSDVMNSEAENSTTLELPKSCHGSATSQSTVESNEVAVCGPIQAEAMPSEQTPISTAAKTQATANDINSQDRSYHGPQDEISAAPQAITLEEAQCALLKVITYLELHPVIGGDHIPNLWKLLSQFEEYARKIESGSVADFYKVKQENGTSELQLRLSKLLKERLRVHKIGHHGCVNSGHDHQGENTTIKDDLDHEVNSDCDLSQKHDSAVGKPLKPRMRPERRKSKRIKRKILLYLDQEEKDEDEPDENEEHKGLCLEEQKDKALAENIEVSEFKRSRPKLTPRHQCDVCKKPFRNLSHLREHALIHTGEKPFKCDTCGKGFRRQGYVRQHQMLHTGEKPFPCPFCEKGFRSTSQLKQHQTVHTGDRPYRCDRCDACFAHAAGLKSHMRRHTGDRPFTCKICSTQLAHAGSLKVHMMRAHTREKPFTCTICRKAFTTAADLKTHQKIHTGDRPYACKLCPRKFSQCGQLKTHMRVHTGEKPYLCTMCGKGFAHTSSLSVHMRVHTGEKPYHCSVCDMRCTDSTNLKKHMRLHRSENLYKCDVCGRGFSQMGSLNKHMTSHSSANQQAPQEQNLASEHQLSINHHEQVQMTNSFLSIQSKVIHTNSETHSHL